jgi:hypothetical protein
MSRARARACVRLRSAGTCRTSRDTPKQVATAREHSAQRSKAHARACPGGLTWESNRMPYRGSPARGGANPGFQVGDVVQYSSDTRGQWLHARVERLHADNTLALSVTTPSGVVERRADSTQVRPRDQGPDSPMRKEVGRDTLERTTTPTGTQYKVGQSIEYASASQRKWVPATVESINRHGELTIRRQSGDRQLVATHKVRHRPAATILQEAARERQRADEARQEAARLDEEARRNAAKAERMDQLARQASRNAAAVGGVGGVGGGGGGGVGGGGAGGAIAYARQSDGHPEVALYAGGRSRPATHNVPQDGKTTPTSVSPWFASVCMSTWFDAAMLALVLCFAHLLFIRGHLLTQSFASQPRWKY